MGARLLGNSGAELDMMPFGGWANPEIMARYGAAQAVDRALAAYDTNRSVERDGQSSASRRLDAGGGPDNPLA